MTSWFRRYLLPGFVFQSVIIAGGYATGRELVEFFLPAGPSGGLLGMLVAMTVWSIVLAISFELIRLTGSYDYRAFFQLLLGRAWFLFEIAYCLLLVLILAIIGAASGEILAASFGLPPLLGTLALMAAIALLVFRGSSLIENTLAGWSFLLYATYIVFIIWCLAVFGDRISASFASRPVADGWFGGGLTYAGYNMAVIPAVFFCLRHLRRRREAIGAGLLAGPIAIIPGLLFYIAMMGYYPEIGEQSVPLNFLVERLDSPWFALLFQIVIFGTFVETGTGMLHAVNERVANAYRQHGRSMPQILRPVIALGLLTVSVFAAAGIGLVDLIASGYGLLTYVFLAVLVLPVLTIGVWKITRFEHKSYPLSPASGGEG